MMVGLSMGVLFAISSSSLFSLRGIASFWLGDKLNLAVAQRIAATPYTQTWAKTEKIRGARSYNQSKWCVKLNFKNKMKQFWLTDLLSHNAMFLIFRSKIKFISRTCKEYWKSVIEVNKSLQILLLISFSRECIFNICFVSKQLKIEKQQRLQHRTKVNLPMFLGFKKSTSPSQPTYTVSRHK